MATASAALSVAAAPAAAVADDRATPSDTERLARSSLTASLTPFILFSSTSLPLEPLEAFVADLGLPNRAWQSELLASRVGRSPSPLITAYHFLNLPPHLLGSERRVVIVSQ